MTAQRAVLPRIVFLGRSAAEYRSIWGLGPEDLVGRRVLDCPCGPAGFVAACRKIGVEAVGCDPVLAESVEEIRRRGDRDRLETEAALAAGDPTLASRDPAAWNLEKVRALEAFLEDFAAYGPAGSTPDGRYVPGSLPDLPFADRSFDLVLSAHLLFTYAPLDVGGLVDAEHALDLRCHLAAVEDLARVAGEELRIYPVYAHRTTGDPRHGHLDPVRTRLEELGFSTRLDRSAYDQGVVEVPDTLIAVRKVTRSPV